MIGILILFTFVSIIVVAIASILAKDSATAVIFFMAVGLGSVVLYLLFQAPDVALTEAVIGTGISTVVFLLGIKHTSKERVDS